MDMWGNKLVGDISLKGSILEDITGFVIRYMELGIVSSSWECVKEFSDPFVYACD